MELFEELPFLRTLAHRDLPEPLMLKLRFQWKALHSMAINALPVSHSISRDFIKACSDNLVDLPGHVRQRLCERCSVIQLPSITCKVRVRARAADARINRNKIKRRLKDQGDKFSNEIVITCLVCSTQSKHVACKRSRGQARRPRKSEDVAPEPEGVLERDRFSFLTVDRRQSAPARLEAAGEPTAVTTHDMIQLGAKRTNLLDLEREHKKRARKSLGQQQQQQQQRNTVPSNASSAQSLGSLRSLLLR